MSDKSGTMWLRDFLPEKIPNARILTYGFNSNVLGAKTSKSGLQDHAYDLLQRIVDLRTTDEVRVARDEQANTNHFVPTLTMRSLARRKRGLLSLYATRSVVLLPNRFGSATNL